MGYVFVFDYDGVIVDSLSIFMKSFLRACDKEGWGELDSKEKFLHLFDGNMYKNMRNMGMTTDDIIAIVYRVRDDLIKHQNEIPLFPGFKDAVSSLAHSHPLLIATSNESRVVQEMLSLHDLDIFKEVLGSDSEPSKVKKLISIKKRFQNDQCVYIGDTIGDIIEGKQAGVITVAVTWGWHDEHRLKNAHPDYILSSPEELIDLDHIIRRSQSRPQSLH